MDIRIQLAESYAYNNHKQTKGTPLLNRFIADDDYVTSLGQISYIKTDESARIPVSDKQYRNNQTSSNRHRNISTGFTQQPTYDNNRTFHQQNNKQNNEDSFTDKFHQTCIYEHADFAITNFKSLDNKNYILIDGNTFGFDNSKSMYRNELSNLSHNPKYRMPHQPMTRENDARSAPFMEIKKKTIDSSARIKYANTNKMGNKSYDASRGYQENKRSRSYYADSKQNKFSMTDSPLKQNKNTGHSNEPDRRNVNRCNPSQRQTDFTKTSFTKEERRYNNPHLRSNQFMNISSYVKEDYSNNEFDDKNQVKATRNNVFISTDYKINAELGGANFKSKQSKFPDTNFGLMNEVQNEDAVLIRNDANRTDYQTFFDHSKKSNHVLYPNISKFFTYNSNSDSRGFTLNNNIQALDQINVVNHNRLEQRHEPIIVYACQNYTNFSERNHINQ